MATLTGFSAVTDVHELLQHLIAQPQLDDPERTGSVLTIYVNLDPRNFATAAARESQVTSLIDTARRDAPDDAWSPVIDRIEGQLRSNDYRFGDAQAVAVYASLDGSLFELVNLPRPVAETVHFNSVAHIRPLVEVAPAQTWCVLLVNRRTTRILLGNRDGLAQADRFEDDVPGQHDQGGWSQARYERSIEQNVLEHLQHTADELLKRERRGDFDLLLIGTPKEMRGQVADALHPYVRQRVYDYFDGDVEYTGEEDLHRLILPFVERHTLEAQTAALERLREGVATAGRAAIGLEAVLEALNERRVEHLLIAQGRTAIGKVCPACGFLTAAPHARCPADDAKLEPVEDVVEAAVESAVRQRAHVSTLGRATAEPGSWLPIPGASEDADRPEFLELQGLGGIAALLRY